MCVLTISLLYLIEPSIFPKELHCYGLDEELLAAVFAQVSSGKKHLHWCLQGVPNVGFYQKLHPFLKKWHITCQSTKVAIGKFYIAIDKHLRERGSRPDNVYRFIEKVANMQPSAAEKIMMYDNSITKLKVMQAEVRSCTEDLRKMDAEVANLRDQLKQSRDKLHSTQCALRDVTNEKLMLIKQTNRAEKKAVRLQAIQHSLENDIFHLIDENSDLSIALSAVESELATDKYSTSTNCDEDFSFQTKCGRKYSPAIRKLYYTLLTHQVPTSKIAEITKTVVSCFNPSIDVEQLKLPKRACAGYMRKEELKTISNAHKAAVLCKQASNKEGIRMNSDGTTKAQRKLGGVAFNDMVVSVNELPDGSAQSVIADISRELEKLRKTAHALHLPNANSINWTLLVSSSSDSASTQKRLNKLIVERREADEKTFGPASFETIDLVENFCSMHLGVNIRKAFLCGIGSRNRTTTDRQYFPVDTLVHEFCKLFGKHGTPEYGCGVFGFKDFLEIMSTDSSLCEKSRHYYQSCTRVNLERQVGSRYFVTAANASKIIFLKEAAVHFLTYTGKDTGNKLERDVYAKLQEPMEIVELIADSLMYYHVYADLVMLSKSNDLRKSSLDMNLHYLELKLYLQEVERTPEIVLDKDYAVFRSEQKLYCDNEKLNHRLHTQSQMVFEELFQLCQHESRILLPILVAGAVSMKEKLCTYAQSHLPGGRYWNPAEPDVRKVLSELTPSNDLCESILGLNDYLTTAIPNLHQMTRSNMVELKRNKTIKWLNDLPCKQQNEVIDLAVEMRQSVQKECKSEDEQRAIRRRQMMTHAHTRREALKKKAQQERDDLSQLHLLSTSKELHQAISDIDKKSLSAAKKTAEKRLLLRTQIKIRKRVLGQNICITFSHSRKQRPVAEIVKELSHYIDQFSSECSECIQDPSALVGKRIKHKFELAESREIKWYDGIILGYDTVSKMHEILYDGEDDHCYFNLTVDILTGDLEVIG